MKKLTSRMIRFARDKLFEVANNSNPAFKSQGQKEFTYDNYNKLKREASLFDVKEWVAVDDINKFVNQWEEEIQALKKDKHTTKGTVCRVWKNKYKPKLNSLINEKMNKI